MVVGDPLCVTEEAEAPPQPPVRLDDSSPALVVDGIGDDRDAEVNDRNDSKPSSTFPEVENCDTIGREIESSIPDEPVTEDAEAPDSRLLLHVQPAELSSFAELLARFELRIDKAATGRKYRELRAAWDEALAEASRYSDRVDVLALARCIVSALKAGCESTKVVVVDSCLDCILRLIEYGHLGSSEQVTEIILDKREGTLDEIVATVCSCLEVKEEEVYLRMVQTLLTAATLTRTGLHHGTLLAAVRTIYNIYLNSRIQSTRTTARVSLTQILNLVFSRMEAESYEAPSRVASVAEDTPRTVEDTEFSDANRAITGPSDSADANGDAQGRSDKGRRIMTKIGADDPADRGTDFSSTLQKDTYLLFRALCKLSAKDVSDDSVADSVSLRSKLLSLALIRSLVNGSGPSFRSGERFIYALRHYLAPSLLTNCMSNSMDVVDVSLDIFETLLRKESLRPLLKTEVGALFNTVIFRFLESSSAGISRRRRALLLLSRLAPDRQILADLFLNYDCDLDSPKIFERIVHVLAQTAESPGTGFSPVGLTAMPSETGASNASEEELRFTALTAIVDVVSSLRNWSKPVEDAKILREAEGSANGVERDEQSQVVSSNERSFDDISHPNGIVREVADAEKLSTISAENQPSSGPPSMSSSDFARLTSILGTVSEGNDQDTTRFEEALKAKKIMEEGVAQFNAKPKRGIDFLASQGRLEKDSEAVAVFLLRSDKLDATMIGEYLGDPDPFCISVMHAYTDMKDMTGLLFDNALRAFLAGFRLPGESQKIDRIMEKFASRYCECNPEVFANAEVAFVLAYSTIMLHTDAHNPMVKRKMTREEFIRNNRGINDGADLSHDILNELYDRTTSAEFRLAGSMKDSTHEAALAAIGGGPLGSVGLDANERARRFKQESDELMAQTKVMFANRRKTSEDYTYFSASNVYHARLMFDAAWCPVLAALSVLLEKASASDSNAVALCLEGFRNSIAIASTFGMITTKDAFVSSLAKFTHLNSISEMRAKNVECTRMILAIAAMEGNNLGEQWIVIVRAISQVEQIRAVAAGNPRKFILQKALSRGTIESLTLTRGRNGNIMQTVGSKSSALQPSAVSPSKMAKGVIGNGTSSLLSGQSTSSPLSTRDSVLESVGPTRRRPSVTGLPTSPIDRALMQVDSKAATVASLIDEAEIERIFVNSCRLSAGGVADFCCALCTVALEELQEATGPRSFCLQKIVEMAYYNMDSRTRMEWAKIWEHMGPFFASAMCHDNQDVSMYAVDALRQLASKFLEKEELSNFSFQRSFLKPFEECFTRSRAVSIREFILTCISQIVMARALNIKSGWKAVFSVLSLAADDKSESVLNLGFQIVESIVRRYFGQLDDVFVDAVNGISAFARSQLSSTVALSAINLLTEKCATTLAEGRACQAAKPVGVSEDISKDCPRSSNKPRLSSNQAMSQLPGSCELPDLSPQGCFTADSEEHITHWFPILTGLAAAMQDDRSSVRMCACTGLFRVLTTYGGRFSPSLWVLIYRGVIAPIFDDVRHLSASTIREEASPTVEWAVSTGSSALRALAEVLVQHLDVARIVLSDLLELLRGWIEQENEAVVREGMGVLSWFMKNAGDSFISTDWDLLIESVECLFKTTMPHEILGPADGAKRPSTGEDNGIGDAGRSPYSVTIDQTGEDAETGIERSADGNERPVGNEKIDFRAVRAKCVVQLLLIQLVQDAVVSFYEDLSAEQIIALARCVDSSYLFAHEFNANIELRFSLWRAGFMNQVPNLLKQETTGLTTFLRIMFWLYLDSSRGSVVEAESKLIPLCDRVLRGFVLACGEARAKPEDRREVAALIPVVTLIVNGMMQMSNEQFREHLPSMYPLLLELMEDSDDRTVRSAVVRLIRARVSPLINFDGAKAQGSEEFVPEPQIPGRARERLLLVKLSSDEESVGKELESNLLKISGVRAATANIETGRIRVFGSTPDDLLLSAMSSSSNVNSISTASGVLDSVEPAS